uniref:thioredoxin domain-containing protein 12-like n=1 Tax=Styela clava TaxID=7725 RepID=UPI00193998A6|nr:thioredoxin domain-containing protein 12-like [Styela clava]
MNFSTNIVHYGRLILRLIIITQLFRLAIVSSSIPLLQPPCSQELARGFGDHINWKTYEEGMAEALDENKPILLLIHQEQCPACHDFAPKFAADENIAECSKYFVMINCKDEEEPSGYTPDGKYYPRIIFLSPKGDIILGIRNDMAKENYLYYYFTPDAVVRSMVRVVKLFYEVQHDGEYEDL